VFGHGARMLRVVADAEQAAMDHRVQRFYPAVHHLGKAGDVGHILDRQPRVAERLGGPAGRDQLDPPSRKDLPELDQAALVRHRKQRTLDGDLIGSGGVGGFHSRHFPEPDGDRRPVR